MGRALLVSAANASVTNNFVGLCGSCNPNNNATEANRATPVRTAGTLSLFTIRVTSTGNRTWTLRKNSANGSESANTTSATIVTDGSNTDSISAGDTIDCQQPATGVLSWCHVSFAASSGHVCLYSTYDDGGIAISTSPMYAAIAGRGDEQTTEENTKSTIRIAGTVKNLFVRVLSNTGAAFTYRARVNGADGNMHVDVGASTTGNFEDTTNTDTIANGDTLNYSITSAGSPFAHTIITKCEIDASTPGNANNDVFTTSAAGINRTGGATTHYFPVSGQLALASLEDDGVSVRVPWAASFSNLRIKLTANSYASDATMRFRKNKTTNGNQVVTITAGVTGVFEDTTNTDTTSTNDQVNFSLTGGTSGTITMRQMGITMQDTANVIAAGSLIFDVLPFQHMLYR